MISAFNFKRTPNRIDRFGVRNGDIHSKERVGAVDVLRGFDMFWIMGGEVAVSGLDKVFGNRISAFFKMHMDHAEWLGFHFYDIIMPLFMFLVGVSMVYSFRNRIRRGHSDGMLWAHTLKRVLLLWVLGMLVQGHLLTFDISQIHLYSNTLQAIAAGYFIASVLLLYVSVRWQIVWTAVLMAAYWLIMVLVPICGTTAGAYTPDHNVAIVFDNLILGHFGDGQPYAWILPSLNFGATTMLGVFCGYMLQIETRKVCKLVYFIVLGAVLIAAGLLLDIWQPIIKKIWTSSFVLFSGGICVLLLAAFYLVVDIWSWKRATRWLSVLGMNAIFGYVMWHLFSSQFIGAAKVVYQGLLPCISNWTDTVEQVGGFLVIYLLMWYMFKNKTFIKI